MDVRRIAKPRPGKISPPRNIMPGQKGALIPNDWSSFYEFKSAKIENFMQVRHFFHSFIKYYTFYFKKLPKT